ncbi:MAG: hypothetical protein NPIRA01_31120 [Nitrospirales bacterium]|nr:MAG: hypothetical protein NPIRA01_31120 [Nitrospirales bacterium]
MHEGMPVTGWGIGLLFMIELWILGILWIVSYVIYFIVEMSGGAKGKGLYRKKRRRH